MDLNLSSFYKRLKSRFPNKYQDDSDYNTLMEETDHIYKEPLKIIREGTKGELENLFIDIRKDEILDSSNFTPQISFGKALVEGILKFSRRGLLYWLGTGLKSLKISCRSNEKYHSLTKTPAIILFEIVHRNRGLKELELEWFAVTHSHPFKPPTLLLASLESLKLSGLQLTGYEMFTKAYFPRLKEFTTEPEELFYGDGTKPASEEEEVWVEDDGDQDWVDLEEGKIEKKLQNINTHWKQIGSILDHCQSSLNKLIIKQDNWSSRPVLCDFEEQEVIEFSEVESLQVLLSSPTIIGCYGSSGFKS